ncbi:putative phosphatase [Marinobacterium lacunae]|uniref:Putative phosphatase n=1 Tax=Marinobacterium lacunae TaxID=1232683 RepID=A0A081FWL0_9GAMM|nr:PhoX family phosphatase [Marinobacterium lacunae]KEA62915.1 putative phosphatase [Marinobacterium lacunae]
MSHKPYDDEDHIELEHSDFDKLVQKGLSRRGFLQGSAAAMGLFLAASPLAKAVAAVTESKLLGFTQIPASTADTFEVPEGYIAEPLISWGDPILKGAPAFDESGLQDSAAQAGQFGDNTDGMSFFPLSEDRGVIAVNNEYTNYEYLFPHQGKEALSADEVKKAQAAVGVSVFEVQRNANGGWSYLKDSKYNRRITANTEMELTGPVAGHALVKTSADAAGKKVLGTFNNCANGQTPWGTYLTCEENFNGFFGTADAAFSADKHQKRYGLKDKSDYQWFTQDERFDIAKNPNEPNRHGWIVEIDPMDPTSTPQKRTALGRFKHENAAVTVDDNGHVVVYLGDDERGEHLYRFVSKNTYNPNDQAANRNLLEEGTLYVARFDAGEGELKGQGQWLELTHGKNGLTQENGFADQAEVLIFAREAATQVGATTMDRPEWIAVHPNNKSVCCTLTNNKYRGVEGKNQPVGGPNPRAKNNYGQIVRWWPRGGDHTAAGFDWDLFVIAGNPTVGEGLYKGSANINADNMFNSPDGLGFDNDGRLWILTDGKYSNEGEFAGMGNNQMLCADPETGEIRRFATGPIACEITGLTFAPDHRAVFVGVQHPGEELAPSHFPAGGSSKPRSTIMVVRRKDGGIIGA